jgi:hypothetical protein
MSMTRTSSLFGICLLTWLITPVAFGQQICVSPNGVFQQTSYAGSCGCGASCDGCRSCGKVHDGGTGTDGGGGRASVTDGGVTDGGGVGERGAPDYGLLAADSFGVTREALGASPGMIGDSLGGMSRMRISSAGQRRPYPDGQTDGPEFEYGTTIAIAGGDQRFYKICDNTSPIPTDRLFIDYQHFSNALVTADDSDANLDRAVLGLEKTFREGLWSFEVRIPFASGLDSDQARYDAGNLATEFGNVAFVLKRLFYMSPTLAASAGLGMVIPTAANATLSRYRDEGPVVTIENEAVYLKPFLGVLWTPNQRVFAQFFGQIDFDANGNTVTFSDLATMPGRAGVIQDQTLLYLDYSFGYWLYHDPCACRFLTGIAPMIELHYTTKLQDSDTVYPDSFTPDIVTNFYNRQDVLNMTAGLCFEVRGTSYLRVAAVAPLKDDGDRAFDGEINAQFVARY